MLTILSGCTQECNLSQKQGFCRYIQFNVRSLGCPLTQCHQRRQPCEDTGTEENTKRRWRQRPECLQAKGCQRLPPVTSNEQRFFTWNQLCQCLDVRLVALVTLREYISEMLSSMVFCYSRHKELMHKYLSVDHLFIFENKVQEPLIIGYRSETRKRRTLIV